MEDAMPYMGDENSTIWQYAKDYKESVPKKFKQIDVELATAKVLDSAIILYGDFHALKQSQRGFLRVLRDAVQSDAGLDVGICMEMVRSCDQVVLDRFMSREISTEEFLLEINYEQNWGFAWKHFLPIFEFAMEHGIPVYGMNSENAGRDDIQSRDEHAAKIISGLSHDHLFCLIGEFHLADNRLIKELIHSGVSSENVLRVFSNIDEYYFEIASISEKNTQFIQMAEDKICVLNAPPWLKWRSFVMWEEMRMSQFLELSEESQWDEIIVDEGFDADHQVFSLASNLNSFLKLNHGNDALSRFNMYYAPDSAFLQSIPNELFKGSSWAERAIVRSERDGFYFVEVANTILMSKMSINNLSEIIGQLLFSLSSSYTTTSKDEAYHFYYRVMKSAAGVLASRVLNPKQKFQRLVSYRGFVESIKGKRLKGRAAEFRDIAKNILLFDSWLLKQKSKIGKLPSKIVSFDHDVYGELAKRIGTMYGVSLYTLAIQNQLEPNTIQKFFKTSCETSVEMTDWLKNIRSLAENFHPEDFDLAS